MTWAKLKRGNDWGNEYLAFKPLDEHGFAHADRAVRIKQGQEIGVRWPGGVCTRELVKMQRKAQTVSDMGYSYDVVSYVPGIEVSIRGVATWLPLDADGLEVDKEELK